MPSIAQPSAQSLLIEMRIGGLPLATGTGFVVHSPRGPVLLTNRHNVTGRRPDNNQPASPTGAVPGEVLIVHNRFACPGEWVTRVEQLYTDVLPRWIDHPRLGTRADFVALPLTQLDDVELYAYDVEDPGPGIALGPAETISVVGFPFGLQAGGSLAVWATGFVASEPQVDFEGLPIFLIDCRSRPGQSGSPVIAYRSAGGVPMKDGGVAFFAGPVTELLGIYSGRINDQSDIGIVWKVAAIRELVRSMI